MVAEQVGFNLTWSCWKKTPIKVFSRQVMVILEELNSFLDVAMMLPLLCASIIKFS